LIELRNFSSWNREALNWSKWVFEGIEGPGEVSAVNDIGFTGITSDEAYQLLRECSLPSSY
jgi:hypothetical protein